MMNAKYKVFVAGLLVAGFFSRERICDHFGFGPSNGTITESVADNPEEQNADHDYSEVNYQLGPDSLSSWNKANLQSSAGFSEQDVSARTVSYDLTQDITEGPIEIMWQELVDIDYELRYFEELDMEIYAPIFPEKIKALNKQEVIIQGFVIPFDAEEELLSLSANPYASCFFCGNASPASVMSMYLKNKRARYKMDDFKTFRGTLYLNSNDPKQFYYILRNAVEE